MHLLHRLPTTQVWHVAEQPQTKAEVDDALFALLTNTTRGIVPLRARELGSFEVPEEEEIEPGRTEHAIARGLTPWLSAHIRDGQSGAALLDLSVWLSDASGSWRGVFYFYAMSVSQLVMAALIGSLSAVPWAQTSTGSKVWLSAALTVQTLSAFWTASGTANDRIDAAEKTATFLLEGSASALMIASSVVAEKKDGEVSASAPREAMVIDPQPHTAQSVARHTSNA